MDAPTGTTVPLLAPGQVDHARDLAVSNQDAEHVGVAIRTEASAASRRDPSLSLAEGRREAGAEVLLVGRREGDLVKARAVGVDPVEVGGAILTLRHATEQQELAVGGERRAVLTVH